MTLGTACWIGALLIAGVLEVYWRKRAWRAEARLVEERRQKLEAIEVVAEQRKVVDNAMRALRSVIAERDALRKRTFH